MHGYDKMIMNVLLYHHGDEIIYHLMFISFCVDVVVTFEQTEFTVNEDVGNVKLCLNITDPLPSIIFPGTFFITAASRNGTATGTPIL